MFVTWEVSQPVMSWSNEDASWNICCMSATLDVTQSPMSSLKDVVSNRKDMSVTRDVDQSEMCPYRTSAEAGLATHASAAAWMLESVRGVQSTLAAAVVVQEVVLRMLERRRTRRRRRRAIGGGRGRD